MTRSVPYLWSLLFAAFIFPSCKKDKTGAKDAGKVKHITAYHAYSGETTSYDILYNADGTVQSTVSSYADIITYSYHGNSIIAYASRGGWGTEYDSTIIDDAGNPLWSLHRDVIGREHKATFQYDAKRQLSRISYTSATDTEPDRSFLWADGDLIQVAYAGIPVTDTFTYDHSRPCQPGDKAWLEQLLDIDNAPIAPRIGSVKLPNAHLRNSFNTFNTCKYEWDAAGRISKILNYEDGDDITWTIQY